MSAPNYTQPHDMQGSQTSIPGGFPESSASPLNVPSSTSDGNSGNEQSNTLTQTQFTINKIFSIFLQIPLFLLSYFVTTVVVLLSIINRFFRLTNFYDKSQSKSSHSSNLNELLDSLTAQSSTSLSSNTSTTYNFGSIYNPESGIITGNQFQHSYTELIEACTKQCKFGLIYIHDPLLDNPMDYVDKILCTEQLVNLIKKYQIMIWFGDALKSEGLQVANALKVRQFPFIGVLTVKSLNKIELIARAEGSLSNYHPNKFERLLRKNYTGLLQLAQQRQNVEMQRLIREQQNTRFRDSLRRDQERDRERADARQREIRQVNQERLREQWLRWRLYKLHPEATDSSIASIVAIRFENNERVVRKFDANLSIEEIYAYVELRRNGMLDGDERNNENINPPLNYTHTYDFKLISPVPKEELDPGLLIKDSESIFPSGNIMIEESDANDN